MDTTTEAYAKCFRIEGDVRVVAGAIDGSAKKALLVEKFSCLHRFVRLVNPAYQIDTTPKSIHPPYILDTFTKLERSESEVPQYERETTIGLWGQDPFRVV